MLISFLGHAREKRTQTGFVRGHSRLCGRIGKFVQPRQILLGGLPVALDNLQRLAVIERIQQIEVIAQGRRSICGDRFFCHQVQENGQGGIVDVKGFSIKAKAVGLPRRRCGG